MFFSPLRYPGGKHRLSEMILAICKKNSIEYYYEPFAGGASIALSLLLTDSVKDVSINDKDRSIYAFWYSVINENENLCEMISNTEINIENWLKQREIQKNKEKEDLLDLGFSTLFLNRTNFSGVIHGGAIGGIEQKGLYKLDCRFNKHEIINRIKNIGHVKERITVSMLDALDYIDLIESDENNKKFIYFDPPYYVKARLLYMNHYKHDDHVALSNRIKKIKNCKWVISYDNVCEIKDMYSEKKYKTIEFTLNHSASRPKQGKELLISASKISYQGA